MGSPGGGGGVGVAGDGLNGTGTVEAVEAEFVVDLKGGELKSV